VKLSAGNL